MTKLQRKLHKLGNAIRAQRGLTIERGSATDSKGVREVPWKRDSAPRKDSATQARVDRWKFRVTTEGQ